MRGRLWGYRVPLRALVGTRVWMLATAAQRTVRRGAVVTYRGACCRLPWVFERGSRVHSR